jgi:mRNA deadenylase 3'-5' endonuclease subunit Ccr4
MYRDPAHEKASFSVASYNVLASAYVHPARYSRTSSLVLNPTWRIPAIVGQVAGLGDDIICLQEIEMEVFSALRMRLAHLGYGSQFARKRAGSVDGCATFYRQGVFELVDANIIAYSDGAGAGDDSGHIALVAVLRRGGDAVGVINTHLLWDPPDAAPETRRGYRQMSQLLREYQRMESEARGWIIAGDLNATPERDTIALLGRAGLDFSHRNLPEAYTCNANARAQMVDYLFYSAALRAEPVPVPRIEDRTVLPSAEHPSDHVPVRAKFYWKVQAS